MFNVNLKYKKKYIKYKIKYLQLKEYNGGSNFINKCNPNSVESDARILIIKKSNTYYEILNAIDNKLTNTNTNIYGTQIVISSSTILSTPKITINSSSMHFTSCFLDIKLNQFIQPYPFFYYDKQMFTTNDYWVIFNNDKNIYYKYKNKKKFTDSSYNNSIKRDTRFKFPILPSNMSQDKNNINEFATEIFTATSVAVIQILTKLNEKNIKQYNKSGGILNCVYDKIELYALYYIPTDNSTLPKKSNHSIGIIMQIMKFVIEPEINKSDYLDISTLNLTPDTKESNINNSSSNTKDYDETNENDKKIPLSRFFNNLFNEIGKLGPFGGF